MVNRFLAFWAVFSAFFGQKPLYFYNINTSMKLTFTNTERPMVYTLELETLHSANMFREELDNENWQVEAFKSVNGRVGGGRHTIDGVGRYNAKANLESIRGTVLKELFQHVLSDEFKLQWLSEMLNTPTFCKMWVASGAEDMANYTILQANYVLDNSFTRIGMHLDNRLLVATGMIYLNESAETIKSRQATTFYTDENKSDPLIITPNFGTGWAAVNTHNSWHEGINMSGQQRYSLLLGIAIDIGKLRSNK